MDESYGVALPEPRAEEEHEVRLARARDPAVWALWFDRHYDTVYRYAVVRLGSREEAEDVAAQVFLRAFQGIGGYHYRGRPVLAWLYTIARNQVADRLRSYQRRPEVRAIRGLQAATVDGVEERIELIELRRALERLKVEQREVVILRFLVGLPTHDVARLLRKSDSAVHSLQVRAMQTLRRLLSR
jgi:RNA polymerase sigma-70 factor (ECF subfamily)